MCNVATCHPSPHSLRSQFLVGQFHLLSSVQYFADAEEANSWLSDRKPLLTSEDHGRDESSTAALLQRHLWLEKEIASYGLEIRRLSEQARSAAQLTSLTVSVCTNLTFCQGWSEFGHITTNNANEKLNVSVVLVLGRFREAHLL